jgi:predicted ArsR family transcriptional regulator
MKTMKLTTRSRILEHLRKYQTASVKELGRAFGMTGANIRHHLAVLESDGMIEMVGQRKEGRGRPLGLYGLSRRMIGNGLVELAGALIDAWLDHADRTVYSKGLRSVAGKLAGKNIPDSTKFILKRLTQAIDRLNELHYRARWEASLEGPRIILGNCPYRELITDHPELCTMDGFMLETQLASSVEQTEKFQASASGLPFCAFLVKGK